MALINCPECEKEVSDSAKLCPHCGYKINSKKASSLFKGISKTRLIIIGVLIVLIIIVAIFLFTPTSYNTRSDSKLSIIDKEVEDSVRIQALAYNDKLSYSKCKITRTSHIKDEEYVSKGYVYFDRIESDKKWETDFICSCKLLTNTALCNCTLGETAHVVP